MRSYFASTSSRNARDSHLDAVGLRRDGEPLAIGFEYIVQRLFLETECFKTIAMDAKFVLRMIGEVVLHSLSSFVREFEIPLDADGNPDYAAGKFVEIKVSAIPVEGGDRIELELKQHDFSADAAGATVAIVPRDDTVAPASNEMWAEWEWHSASDDETTFESAAQTGSLVLGVHEGEVDSTGLVLTGGSVGGFLRARWSQSEEVTISFTVPCTEEKLSFIQ